MDMLPALPAMAMLSVSVLAPRRAASGQESNRRNHNALCDGFDAGVFLPFLHWQRSTPCPKRCRKPSIRST
eukprot:2851841-Lingulodinium_polyedra.AAC.1